LAHARFFTTLILGFLRQVIVVPLSKLWWGSSRDKNPGDFRSLGGWPIIKSAGDFGKVFFEDGGLLFGKFGPFRKTVIARGLVRPLTLEIPDFWRALWECKNHVA